MANTVLETIELELPALDLPAEDGEFLETRRHRLQMNLCIDLLAYNWRERNDFFVSGNMFIYYSLQQARQIIAELEAGVSPGPQTAFRGPAVFVVLGTDNTVPREKWVVWEENGRYPNVIIELLSPSTAQTDLTTKKDLYEQIFRTPEYFVWDPFDPAAFAGWRLSGGVYEPIAPDERGWLWSEELGLWLGPWEGETHRARAIWLRYYDREGYLLPTSEEQAEAEHQARLEAEQRAEALAAELARLRAERGGLADAP